MENKKCSICESLLPLDEHLEELALFCIFVGEVNDYDFKDEKVSVSINKVGEWLKLAADLKSVEISPGGFTSVNDFYCETRMEVLDEDSRNYSQLSLKLTKYIFAAQAFENMQKFLNGIAIERGAKKRSHTLRCEELFDTLNNNQLPVDFHHHATNFTNRFESYREHYKPSFNNELKLNHQSNAYAHCLLRNLRNYVSHGSFPLEYGLGGNDVFVIKKLSSLLTTAIRLYGIYIQAGISNFCRGMTSDLYESRKERCEEDINDDYDEGECVYFLENFNLQLARKLHYPLDFSVTSYNF
jgi:hypothetical protein